MVDGNSLIAIGPRKEEPEHADYHHAAQGQARPGEAPGGHQRGFEPMFGEGAAAEGEQGQDQPAPEVDRQVAAHVAVVLPGGITFEQVARLAQVGEQPVEKDEAVKQGGEGNLDPQGDGLGCRGLGCGMPVAHDRPLRLSVLPLRQCGAGKNSVLLCAKRGGRLLS